MLPCEIRNGTPRTPKTPVLTANATGATDRPEMEPPKNQCVMSAPGAMKSRRVATKATGGAASPAARGGGAAGRPEGGAAEAQCVMGAGGAVKSGRGATKATGGAASVAARRGASR